MAHGFDKSRIDPSTCFSGDPFGATSKIGGKKRLIAIHGRTCVDSALLFKMDPQRLACTVQTSRCWSNGDMRTVLGQSRKWLIPVLSHSVEAPPI
jgi:hypothetical protein